MMYYERQKKPKPPLDYKSALQKAADYCAYQERSQQQVRDKLYDYGLHHDEVEEAISELITQGFINEERFARAYVRGKFRMRGWGRNKIRQGIRQHKISDYCLRKGFEEINPEVYYEKLLEHTEKKYRSISANSEYIIKGKLTQHLMGKGFEGDLIREAIEEVLSKGGD
ncbi:regulatory protein RecX [Roseivirga pacifica]|uniref:regulatory protein RecX n=1 Tax=Roseivirga pacifica TaxID=1267423 RepID=UPI003BB0F7C5